MENIATDIISLLRYLLPGFLAAWIFYGFTSYPKPSQFERVVQALIFTLIVQTFVYCAKATFTWAGNYFVWGKWSIHSELITSIVVASIMGFVFAYFANTDKFHSLARRIGITRETSFPSEWFGVFSKNITYVILHLNDERRIYGWPIEWPSEPGKGHFSLQQVSWLDEKGETPISGVDSVLIKSEDVKWVEFMDKTWEDTNGKEITESTTAAQAK
ncbi:DUF6338 family protein [Idiomarina abyssalis]|uniref:Uncharacterized protein n=1 Tax=Idiomarina abyssalis TaxID=86102 RepID=A0A8I1GAP0_9GAMM|nr:DUF6338 family protein [Idiomarina abyssalis]MBJ7268055.1 hypothetical protein [Idiomarina abyssalis]MBJ7272562.1 hypothetical protein [Idiomarina abyssalis]MBJ7316520.1 hypothetical protein [Idiomarina abyssalis]